MELIIKRIMATIIDEIIVCIPAAVIAGILSLMNYLLSLFPFMSFIRHPAWIFQIVVSLIFIVYETIALYMFKTTIGKSLLNLKVKPLDDKLDFWDCLSRSTIKSIGLSAPFFLISIISAVYMAAGDAHSSIHDIAAKTRIW